MKKFSVFTLPVILALSACNSSQRPPLPQLPEGEPTKEFNHNRDSFLRGVKGNYNTSPGGRPAQILHVKYQLSCLSGKEPSAESRFKSATKLINDTYTLAPLYFDNPRENGEWRRSATRLIADKTGCVVKKLNYQDRTSNETQVLLWVLTNKPSLIKKKDGKKG